MRNGYRIMDCDRHVMEPKDLFENYLEPEFRHHGVSVEGWYSFFTTIKSHAPYRYAPGNGADPRAGLATLTTRHKGMDAYPEWRYKFRHSIARHFDNVAYLADMDREDIDRAALFTSIGLYATYRDDIDVELAAGICRAYNNWLADYCSIDNDRMKGVCMLPVHDPSMAEAELRRCIANLSMAGIFWRPNPVLGRRNSDEAYFGLWAACEEHDVVLCVHEGQQEVLPYFTRGRNDNVFTRHATCHPTEQMGAFLQLVADGVLDRFPRLRVAFLESGSGWLPYWLERLDTMCDNPLLRNGYNAQHKPSEYFRRGQCYISCEADEETLTMMSRLVGEDCLMWASDYPHPDDMESFPNTVGGIFDNHEISDEFRRKILWDNPNRFYGFEGR